MAYETSSMVIEVSAILVASTTLVRSQGLRAWGQGHGQCQSEVEGEGQDLGLE